MATVYLCKGKNDLSSVTFSPGQVVRIEVPTGYRWVPCEDGTIDVVPLWWGRIADWMLDRTPLEVIAVIGLASGILAVL